MSDATARRRGAAAGEQAETRPVGSVPVSDGPITVGSKVVTPFGNVGTVEKMDKDVAEVLVGGLRLRERIANLRPAAPTGQPSKQSRAEKLQKQSAGTQLRPENAEAVAELNLIGKTTADADYELDRFIDEAYMAQLPRVRIIHGFGTGALKNFVHHFLKNNDLIERFEFAPPEQGGNGATIATLKQ